MILTQKYHIVIIACCVCVIAWTIFFDRYPNDTIRDGEVIHQSVVERPDVTHQPVITPIKPKQKNHTMIDDSHKKLARDMKHVRNLLHTRQYYEALIILKRLNRDYPNYLSVNLMLIHLFIRLDRRDLAQAKLQKLIANPNISDVGYKMATQLLARLKQYDQSQSSPPAEYSFMTSMAVGVDGNIRRASSHTDLVYHLENLAVLDSFNLRPIIGHTPGLVNETQDRHKNELYYETVISASRSARVPMTPKASWNLSARFVDRQYDTYDDDNDGIGDGDYQIKFIRASVFYPDLRRLYGLNISVTDFDSLGQRLSRSYEISGKIMSMLSSHQHKKAKRPTLMTWDILWSSRDFEAFAANPANTTRSGDQTQLRGIYQHYYNALNIKYSASIARHRHQKNTLNHYDYDAAIQLAQPINHYTVSGGLTYRKRINDTKPSRYDFEAVWGDKRRHDDIWIASMQLARKFEQSDRKIHIRLSARYQHADSNLPRYAIKTTNVALITTVEW